MEVTQWLFLTKMFELLIDHDMKKKDLEQIAKISPASVSKMAKNEYASMEVIVKVYVALNVDIGDIMKITKETTVE